MCGSTCSEYRERERDGDIPEISKDREGRRRVAADDTRVWVSDRPTRPFVARDHRRESDVATDGRGTTYYWRLSFLLIAKQKQKVLRPRPQGCLRA